MRPRKANARLLFAAAFLITIFFAVASFLTACGTAGSGVGNDPLIGSWTIGDPQSNNWATYTFYQNGEQTIRTAGGSFVRGRWEHRGNGEILMRLAANHTETGIRRFEFLDDDLNILQFFDGDYTWFGAFVRDIDND